MRSLPFSEVKGKVSTAIADVIVEYEKELGYAPGFLVTVADGRLPQRIAEKFDDLCADMAMMIVTILVNES